MSAVTCNNSLLTAPQHRYIAQTFTQCKNLRSLHPPCRQIYTERQNQHRQTAAASQPEQEVAETASSSSSSSVHAAEGHQRKFNPFSAKRDIRLALLNFRYEVEMADGTLVITPLTRTRLREATDLLTEVFAATDDRIGLYSTYMRGQIRNYLENHLRIAPDAIVLMALLHPRSSASRGAGSSAASTSVHSSADSNGSLAGVTEAANAETGNANGAAPGTVEAAVGEAADSPTAAAAAAKRLQADDTDSGVFVGTVEMSFTDGTRTKYLTCNAPRDSAYLGNMCTDKAHRRRGYGMHLLRAAEQLTRLASYPTIYLHLRFKDKMAAEMYEKAQYREVERDPMWRAVLGMDRRFLMAKSMGEGQFGSK